MTTILPLQHQDSRVREHAPRQNLLPVKRKPARSYQPWLEPMSERRINTLFEERVLPELSMLLDSAFQEFPYLDREEAVQDAVCQALEAYRVLKLYEISQTNAGSDRMPIALANFASSRYLAGIRFAAPRSISCL